MNAPERVPCPYGLCVFHSCAKRSVNISVGFLGLRALGSLSMPTGCDGVIGGERSHYASDFVGIRARPTK